MLIFSMHVFASKNQSQNFQSEQVICLITGEPEESEGGVDGGERGEVLLSRCQGGWTLTAFKKLLSF